jgi:hypothetical protein
MADAQAAQRSFVMSSRDEHLPGSSRVAAAGASIFDEVVPRFRNVSRYRLR